MISKKSIIVLLVLGILFPILSLAAVPQEIPVNNITDFWRIIIRILRFIWPVFVGIAIIMFLISGFLFITAQGDASRVKTARDSLIWGAVGMIIGILAVSIPYIIGTAIGL